VQLPTPEQKAQIQMQLKQLQMAAQQPPQPGMQPPQQPPPEALQAMQGILKLPTWEEVMELLGSDQMRLYRIDIQTDSTIEETLMRDAQGMQESITAIVNLGAGLGPAIQQGILSVEVFKSLAAAVARTMRMGTAVEDAIDQIKQPPPQSAAPDNSVDVAKVEAESNQKMTAATENTKLQIAQMKQQSEERMKTMQAQMDAQQADFDRQLKQAIAQLQEQTKQFVAGAQIQSDERKQQVKVQSEEAIEVHKKSVDADVEREANERSAQAQEENARVAADAAIVTASVSADAARDNAETSARAKAEAAKNKPPVKKK
jgi:hypothetical protein